MIADPVAVGRRMRAADRAYRALRKRYGKRAIRYASSNPGTHGPKRKDA